MKIPKKYTNCFIFPFFMDLFEYKMNVASNMLSSKNYNVNEVALHLGYSTASHFINAFKKKFGTTPKKYLNSN